MQNKTETPTATITPQPTSSSQKDKQLAALLFLKEFSCRLDNVKKELTSFVLLFPNQKYMTWSQRSALISIEKSIVPFISTSLLPLNNAEKLLSPISSTSYVHDFKEREKNELLGRCQQAESQKAHHSNESIILIESILRFLTKKGQVRILNQLVRTYCFHLPKFRHPYLRQKIYRLTFQKTQ